MAQITIRIPTPLRAFTSGEQEVEVHGNDVGSALQQLGTLHADISPKLFNDQGELRSFVNVYLGSQDQRTLQGLATPVADGDVISILPAVAGGLSGG